MASEYKYCVETQGGIFMKKLIALAMLVCMCGATLFAQKYTIVRTEKNVTLPDGNVGDLSFFKKHSDLSNYAKHTRPQDKKTISWTTAITVKDEKELGDFHKTYKENENEVVRKICEIHKETDSKYSLAWVDLGDIVVRAVFQYQKGKLTYDRLNYFDEQNEIYMAYLAKKNAKEEKIESTVKSVVGTVLGSSTNSITSNSNARGADTNNQQERTYTYTDGDGNVIYSKTLILP